MTRNLSPEFAATSEEERARFELKRSGGIGG